MQTALAQVPEETVAKKQPPLQPSRLTVSSFGQHESRNRTYSRTMYSVGTGELIRMKFWWNYNEKTELLNKNLPYCHFANNKSPVDWPGIEPRRPWQ
jgi:hypothetical protein